MVRSLPCSGPDAATRSWGVGAGGEPGACLIQLFHLTSGKTVWGTTLAPDDYSCLPLAFFNEGTEEASPLTLCLGSLPYRFGSLTWLSLGATACASTSQMSLHCWRSSPPGPVLGRWLSPFMAKRPCLSEPRKACSQQVRPAFDSFVGCRGL